MAFPTKVVPFSQACKTWLDDTYATKIHTHDWLSSDIINKPTIPDADVKVVASAEMGSDKVSYIRLRSPGLSLDVCIYMYLVKTQITEVKLPIPISQVMGVAWSGTQAYNRKGRVYVYHDNSTNTSYVRIHAESNQTVFQPGESFIVIATVH